MKNLSLLLLTLLFFSCKEAERRLPPPDEEKPGSIIIDSAFRDTVKRNIQLTSTNIQSQFKTKVEAQFLLDGVISDSINEPDHNITSWYSIYDGKIDLVAHINEFVSVALLLRFTGEKIQVRFFRAAHEREDKRFRINKGDSLSNRIEVLPVNYKLQLSEIPDTVSKQIVYGYIDMESGDYYDTRDSTEQKHRVKMKFYFRSQYRKFEF